MRSRGGDEDQPTELLELAARAEARDVGPPTLDLVDFSVDELARAYPRVRAALRRCAVALDRQSQQRPLDHHFYFDGDKLDLYSGTALSWLGDPAAEDFARHAAARYETGDRPRRLATAYLDLGLVLARLGRPDEAAHVGMLALGANHLVPLNAWRADELVAAVSQYRGVSRCAGG